MADASFLAEVGSQAPVSLEGGDAPALGLVPWASQVGVGGVIRSARENPHPQSLPCKGRVVAVPHRRGATRMPGLILLLLVVGMVGAAYAAVPLYYAFCAATGYGGTPRSGQRQRQGRHCPADASALSTPTSICPFARKVMPPAPSEARIDVV